MGSRGVVGWATAVYAWWARLLPGEFRRVYGTELVECFGAIACEARRRSRLAVVSVLVRSIVDLVVRAPREHLTAVRAGVLAPGSGWSGTALDVRQAARRLHRRPGFAVASVLTLGLGIAAATSVFSLVHGVVLSPLPYPDSERIVVVDHGAEGLGVPWGLGVTYGFHRFYVDHVRGAESMAMYQGLELTLTGAGDPVQLEGVRATPSLAAVLRLRPALGRWFTAEEGTPGAPLVAILSDRVWRGRFGADRGIIGSSVTLGDEAYEVVGVMADDFAFPDREVDFWVPRVVPTTGVGGWNEKSVARLAPGVTPESLAREMERLYPLFREITDDPGQLASFLDDAGIFPRIVPLKESEVGEVRATLWLLLGTVGFVLLIAVANVANLFLVQSETGQRERAVRTALGAGRYRLLRGSLAESLLVTLAAAVVGIAGAAAAVRLLKARAPVNVPRLHEVGLDPVVLAVAVGVAATAALLLGLIPSLRPVDGLSESLKEGGLRSTGGRRRLRGRNVLVATQVALALVLLIGSGLLFRTFQELRSVDPGFATRDALTFEVGLPSTRYPDRAAAAAFNHQFLDRLRALPGVRSAAAIGSCLPLTPHMCWGETLQVAGSPTPEGQVPPVVGTRIASTDYFETLGIPVRGRAFSPADARGAATVVVLSEAAAEAYFPGEDPIGERVRFGDGDRPWHTVVGVAANVKGRVETDDFQRLIYLPVLPEAADGPPPSRMVYVLRSWVPPSSLTDPARRAVAGLDPGLPLARVQTLRSVIDDATAPTAFALTLIGLAAAIALLLGAVGIYAVVAYAVSRRTAEIGVRMALGARARDVRRMVFRQGGIVVLAGIAVGLAAAAVLTRLMRGMLFGVEPTDPASYAFVTALLVLVSAVALYLPARRASRVDPMEAIRGE